MINPPINNRLQLPTAEPSAPAQHYFSVPDAARYLGISKRHLDDLIKEGVIPRIKLGRRILIRRTQIEAVMTKLETRGR